MNFIKSTHLIKITSIFCAFLSFTSSAKLNHFVTFANNDQKIFSNQPPEISWKHPEIIEIKAGSNVNLSFTCSDPEFHRMTSSIRQLKDQGTGKSMLKISSTLNSVQINVTSSASLHETYFIQLEIKDEGNPPQSAFKVIQIRII